MTPRSRSISVEAKVGIEDEVGEDVERDGDVIGQRFDVEADGLFAGEGVEVAADGVHFAGDVAGRSGIVVPLKTMCSTKWEMPLISGSFAARAGFDPDAHGDGTEMLHALGQDDQAVGQYSTAKISLSMSSSLSRSLIVRRSGLQTGVRSPVRGLTSKRSDLPEVAGGCKGCRNALCWDQP